MDECERRDSMRRILSLIAVVALMVAFAMPVMTADAASHEKPQEAGKEMMKKGEDEGKEMMKKGEDEGKKAMKEAGNPCNPCAQKKH
jgi:hypothetical protein